MTFFSPNAFDVTQKFGVNKCLANSPGTKSDIETQASPSRTTNVISSLIRGQTSCNEIIQILCVTDVIRLRQPR